MNRFLLKLAMFVTVLLFIPAASFACSYSIPRYEVQTSFSVVVKSGQRSFAGVRVILQQTEEKPHYKTTVVSSARTDEHGIASFKKVDNGTYLVSIDQLNSMGLDAAYVSVSPDHVQHELELNWPGGKFIELSRISGTLLSAPNGKPLESLSLTLVDGLTGSRVSGGRTDDSGQFDLGTPENGFYFLQLYSGFSGERELTGYVPVIVEPKGKASISLAAEQTTCGLYYGELCHAGKIVTSHLKGWVGNTLNPGFPATLVLSERPAETARALQLVTANENGDFDFANVAPGDYELKVSYYFQSPLIVPVTVEPTRNNSAPLRIEMSSLGGTCVDAKVELKAN